MKDLTNLKTQKLRFYFRAKSPIYLPEYKGATFRGTFGHTFKKIVCTISSKDCRKCPLSSNCIYYYVFETPFDGGEKMGGFSTPKAPQPFIVEPMLTDKRDFKPGEDFTMDLVLVGKAIDYLPYFLYTFEEMGRTRGIGKYKHNGFGGFKLEQVEQFNGSDRTIIYQDGVMHAKNLQSDNNSIDENPNYTKTNLLINFITPTRLKHAGALVERNRNKSMDFQLLIKNIYRRAYLLYFSHQGKDLPLFEELIPEPVETLNKTLQWKELYHYSNRSRRKVPTGGFLGSIIFGDGWQEYYPLIKLGEIIHIGKETTFGLGKYQATVLS
jgi:hypothetical protein